MDENVKKWMTNKIDDIEIKGIGKFTGLEYNSIFEEDMGIFTINFKYDKLERDGDNV
jgi:hypothetical protein